MERRRKTAQDVFNGEYIHVNKEKILMPLRWVTGREPHHRTDTTPMQTSNK